MWSEVWGQRVPTFGSEITRYGQRYGVKGFQDLGMKSPSGVKGVCSQRVDGSGMGRDGGGTEAEEASGGGRGRERKKKQNLHQGVRKNR